jgi:hypothetical protein
MDPSINKKMYARLCLLQEATAAESSEGDVANTASMES